MSEMKTVDDVLDDLVQGMPWVIVRNICTKYVQTYPYVNHHLHTVARHAARRQAHLHSLAARISSIPAQCNFTLPATGIARHASNLRKQFRSP